MTDDRKDKRRRPPYDIGYGKPPVSGRWVKGQSGNPRGRRPKRSASKPPADRTTRDRFLRSADRILKIQENGKELELPMAEAVERSEAVSALRGSSHAQRNYLEREARYRNERAAEIREEYEFWQKYVGNYDAWVAALQKAGKALPQDWPHPEDLVFEEGQYVIVIGGGPAQAARDRELRIRFRDVFILQSEKDRRHFRATVGHSEREPIFVSEFLANQLNSSLPKRLQLDDLQFVLRMDRGRTLKKRELQRRLQQEWTDLGIPDARDLITPPIGPLLVKPGTLT